MRWRFYLDGRIEPAFGFSAVDASCVYHSHRHHAYWRLDFDIDGPANDLVTEGPNPGSGGGRGNPRFPIVTLPTEAMRREQPARNDVVGHRLASPTAATASSRATRWRCPPTTSRWATSGPCATRRTRSTTAATSATARSTSAAFLNGERPRATTSCCGTGRARYHAGGDLDDCDLGRADARSPSATGSP